MSYGNQRSSLFPTRHLADPVLDNVPPLQLWGARSEARHSHPYAVFRGALGRLPPFSRYPGLQSVATNAELNLTVTISSHSRDPPFHQGRRMTPSRGIPSMN
jgi:hypothetical protein